MSRKTPKTKNIEKIIKDLVHTYTGDSGINFIDVSNLPLRDNIVRILDLLMEVLFPGYTGKRTTTRANINFIIGDILCQVYSELCEQIEHAFRYGCRIKKCEDCDCGEMAHKVTNHLFSRLPAIRQMLKGDVAAAYEGDPAAQSFEEIVISYPCITAIATHRIAHELYLKQVPLIPRITGECAHTRTGIDIHPGATIGKNFFIDHGTGVVIGETAIIGNNVKIYQGVTLGALAPDKGQSLRGVKRHPTIEDNVTIYAEATILGNVVIGKGTVIGGNVWIKESVPAGVNVTTANPDLVYKRRKKKKPKQE
jgi:serine O-acetyltransferase